MRCINTIILLLIFMIAVLPGVIATQENLGVFRLNECINLVQTCSNCSFIQLEKIQFPNSSIVYINQNMTKTGLTEFNYTFCNASSNYGEYIVSGFGDPDAAILIWEYTYLITPTGFKPDSSQTTSYLIILVISLFALIGCLIGMIAIKWQRPRNEDGIIVGRNDLKYLKIVFAAASYLLLMFIAYLLYAITNSYIYFNQISNLFYYVYSWMLRMLLPVVIVALIISIANLVRDKKIDNMMKMGVKVR